MKAEDALMFFILIILFLVAISLSQVKCSEANAEISFIGNNLQGEKCD